MKISYDDINNRNDSYQLFLDNIESRDCKKIQKTVGEISKIHSRSSISKYIKEKFPARRYGKRLDELENGLVQDRTRSLESFYNQDDSKSQIMNAIFQMWFEMRATEEEKRIIWRKLRDAKKE